VIAVAKVTFLPSGQSVEFDLNALPYDGHGKPKSFLDVAENFGIHLEHACGGSCACTTCHVVVRKGAGFLTEMDDDEADRIDMAADLQLGSRLGCQSVITSNDADIVIEIPTWNRNYVSEGGGSMNLGDAIPAPAKK
jgi:ferredoxin, 2Fe-2S